MHSVMVFVLASAAFAWGTALASYRWVALQNAWPLGAWQAERAMLPRLIGLSAVVAALLGGLSLGGAAVMLVVLLGLTGAVIWTVVFKVAAQSALLLAPGAVGLLLAGWLAGG